MISSIYGLSIDGCRVYLIIDKSFSYEINLMLTQGFGIKLLTNQFNAHTGVSALTLLVYYKVKTHEEKRKKKRYKEKEIIEGHINNKMLLLIIRK